MQSEAPNPSIETIETTRRCARSHSGSHRLDATSKRGQHYECRGCRAAYSHREAVEALHVFPSATPGVGRCDL